MSRQKIRLAACAATVAVMGLALGAHAGNLTPPGAPASTMKTLDQVQPGTPIATGDLPLTISTEGYYYLTEDINTT